MKSVKKEAWRQKRGVANRINIVDQRDEGRGANGMDIIDQRHSAMCNPAFCSKNLPKSVHKVNNRAFGCIL